MRSARRSGLHISGRTHAHSDMDVHMVADSGNSASWPAGDRPGDPAQGLGGATHGTTNGKTPIHGVSPGRRVPPTMNADDFDALADLFLGEVSPAGTMPAGTASTAGADGRERSADDRTRGDIGQRGADGTVGPERTRAEPARGSTSGAGRGRLELLLVGHLPVMTSAWVGQFVRQESQPTEHAMASALAFVRLHDERLRIERYAPAVRTRRDIADDATGSAIVYEPGDEPMALCLAEERVLVWAQGAIDVLAAQPGLFARAHVLTAGDETGVVNAYRTIKSLVDAWRRAGLDPAEQPTFALSVMGVPMERARIAHARLSEACRSFLGLELRFHASIERIGATAVLPTPPRVAFDEETGWTVGEVIGAVSRPTATQEAEPGVSLGEDGASAIDEAGEPDLGALDGDERIEVVSDLRLVEPALDDTSELQAINPDLSRTIVHPEASASPGVEPIADQGRTFAERIISATAGVASGASASVAPLDAGAATTSSVNEHAEAATVELDLARFVPGLAGIAARCPYAEEVQMAVDALGRLHLMAHADDDDASAIEWLTVAGAWATEHLRLLGMTLPTSQRLDESLRPTMHLFSARATRVRRLLDTDLRVHVLADAGKAAQAGLVAVALN